MCCIADLIMIQVPPGGGLGPAFSYVLYPGLVHRRFLKFRDNLVSLTKAKSTSFRCMGSCKVIISP